MNFGHFEYETRIVSFFDVLGWRRKIEQANENPQRLAELALMAHMLSVFEAETMEAQDGAVLSSFSDNVAISIRYSPEYLSSIVMGLARIQLGFAVMGYYVRGSLTIGRLHHTKKAVFGPALIRAYDIERSEAIYPRIVLDTHCPELQDLTSPLLVVEHEVTFVDPFQPAFAQELQENQRDVTAAVKELEKVQGVPLEIPNGVVLPGDQLLEGILVRLKQELESQLDRGPRKKLEWLRDRIVNRKRGTWGG